MCSSIRNISRPTEVDVLIADASKAARVLKWKPQIKFNDLVKIMIDADLRAADLFHREKAMQLLQKNSRRNGGNGIDDIW